MKEQAIVNPIPPRAGPELRRDPTAPHGKFYYCTMLIIGTISCSSSVIFLRQTHSSPIIVAGMRLWIAAIALLPVMLVQRRSWQGARISVGRQLLLTVPAAAMLAAHFIAWAEGARMTPAANASLIVNLTPVGLPFFMWMINGERINRGELIGVTLAMVGMIGLMGRAFQINDHTLNGDLVCLGAMLLFCIYITVGRRAGNGMGLWMYVVPMYAMAGAICLATAVMLRVPAPEFSLREAGLLLGLGLFPTVIGHSVLNHVIKHLRGSTVSMISSQQGLSAAAMGYVFLGEVPSPTLYLTGLVMLVGSVVVIRSAPPLPPPEPD